MKLFLNYGRMLSQNCITSGQCVNVFCKTAVVNVSKR